MMRLALMSSLLLTAAIGHAQTWPVTLTPNKKDSTKTNSRNKAVEQVATIFTPNKVSTAEAGQALRQALEIGAGKASQKLSLTDGYFAQAAIKILLPPEAAQVEKTLRRLGMGKMVDDAILSMNRAAEQAAASAAPIFVQAIRSITVDDAWQIIKGSDTAATAFLRSKTTLPLTTAFSPVIDSALQRTDATRYWQALFSQYNRFAVKKVNPNLSAYVTERALYGLFVQLGQEEKEIRRNPIARTTELLQKVFGQQR